MPTTLFRYQAQPFTFIGLKGLSETQMAEHYALYEGYVKNTNLLNEKLGELRETVDAAKPAPEFSELQRHLGFEQNGMVLHELFFGNLKADGGSVPSGSKLARAIEADFGAVATWEREFRAILDMRGVGWAILYQDPTSRRLSNHWITLHDEGHIAGYRPILVVDAWEHAWTVDYKPTERAKYVAAVMGNIGWSAAESRMM
ncbi:MAG: superoxide dismutase [Candidatus Sericytochromatia bacterium]|nr:superoxide dismutase [Candidatus Sericytochromatia bacterium]